ncbi:2OG-Fe(II) oxygenase [Pseudomonas phage vB_PpuP-Laguja-5]
MHLVVDGLTCIPQQAWLHPELRQHLPALKSLARVLTEGGHEIPTIVVDTELDALEWLQRGWETGRVYSIPMFSEEYCDKLIAEADGMHYEVNEDEEQPYQIPEVVLANECEALHKCMAVYLKEIIVPICEILFGSSPTWISSIQLARYTPQGVGHGNWHVDADSLFTAVVSLNPESFKGGGTDIRTGPLSYSHIPALPKGHALLFHGKTTLHRGCEVTEGRRDLLVFWSEVKDGQP